MNGSAQNDQVPSGMPRGWGELLKTEGFNGFQKKKSFFSFGGGKMPKFLPFVLIGVFVLVGGFLASRFLLPKSPTTPGGTGQPKTTAPKLKSATLNYWGLWEPNEVMGEIIADWEKAHPEVKINYAKQSPKEYRERLQSAFARGEGPDIFRFHSTWLPMLRNELDVVPATVMTPAQYEGSFYPVVMDALKVNNQYFGVPVGVDSLVLYYNKSILQTVGESPPTTWEEARILAKKITDAYRTKDGRIQVAGMAMGITSNIDHWSDILGMMMLQNGVDLANPTGQLAEDVLTYYTIFYKEDKVWNETLPLSILAFAGEKAAMVFGYSWDAFEIKRANPELDFGVVAAPQLALDSKVSWASVWSEGISKKSKNRTEAWEFLKYLSSKEVMEKMYQAASKTRLYGEPYSRKEMAESLSSNPLMKPYLDQMPTAKTWYLCSRTYDNGINDRMIKYFEDAVNAVSFENRTPKEALTTTASGVSQLLSQYGLASPAR